MFNVIAKQEYTPSSHVPTKLGVAMMIKNEKKRLLVTLKTLVGYADALIIYDTGSTDDTTKIVETFCKESRINLYMIQGEFVNFCESRNVLLAYANTIEVDFLLLLDCNDELRGGKMLRQIISSFHGQVNTGFLVCQQWWSGMAEKYFNIRLIKTRSGWEYRGVVHEWLKDTSSSNDDPKFTIIRLPDEIVIYQDRTQDDDKSGKRFHRDYDMLLAEYKKNPKDSRTVFYLSQTCSCINKIEEAYYYARRRLELGGFEEERFHSYMRCGNMADVLGHEWCDVMGWYIKALEHSERIEPIIKIANHYRSLKKWQLAYMFMKQGINMKYPEELLLFVDKGSYDYVRWHLMGNIAYYVEDYVGGHVACIKAIRNGRNVEMDTKNLQFYLKKTEELKNEKETQVKTQVEEKSIQIQKKK